MLLSFLFLLVYILNTIKNSHTKDNDGKNQNQNCWRIIFIAKIRSVWSHSNILLSFKMFCSLANIHMDKVRTFSQILIQFTPKFTDTISPTKSHPHKESWVINIFPLLIKISCVFKNIFLISIPDSKLIYRNLYTVFIFNISISVIGIKSWD